MYDLERYIHAEDGLDDLIRAALIHYQFETVHLSGRERSRGRLLVTLYLLNRKVLSVPVLCISQFLKMNHAQYYDRLAEVRRKGNYEQWVRFFSRLYVHPLKTPRQP